MRVLVTGATGFTGGHLARTLRQRGHDVRALVRDRSRAKPLVADGIEAVEGDLADANSLKRASDGCEVVYHIAAVYREAKHGDDWYRQINVRGTQNVMDAAQSSGVRRVVHCSTVGVHGEVAPPADENAPFAPGDIYQQTKLEGEQLVQGYIDRGADACIFRPVGIYGPGDLRFLKLFKTISNGSFRMIGRGNVLYHMTFIEDLVDGIILCGEHPAARGRTYILSGPRYTPLSELVAQIAQALGKPAPKGRIPLAPVYAAAVACEALCRPLRIEPPLHRRRLDFFIKDRGFSSARARAEIGFAPRVDLPEGTARTAKWYRDQGLI
jgi:nucleoside-diphosphate-sugar epimerase